MTGLGPMRMSQRVIDVYRCIKGAADRGERCPSNAFLATVGGYSGASHATDAVATLETLGLIEVVRFARARRVRVVETDCWTAPIHGRAIRYLPNRKRCHA